MNMLSGLELSESFKLGTSSPLDLAEECFEKINNYPDASVFISLTKDEALQEAKASARRYKLGQPLSPLDGVPISWKDLVNIAGTVTTAGSEIHRFSPPALADAPIVKHARLAGMVTIGKVNLSEFAYSAVGHNPHYGTPRNVHDAITHRIPGGSSSGSAVSVAAGLVPISIGTDTGGSIRIPAALNGVVGFKTSEGQIDKSGVFCLSDTLDTIGPIASTVSDCIVTNAILRGLSVTNTIASDLLKPAVPGSIHLVVPTPLANEGTQPEVLSTFEKSIELLRTAGVKVTRKRVQVLEAAARLQATHGSLNAIEAYHQHRKLLQSSDAQKIDPLVLRRLLETRDASAIDLLEILKVRNELAHEFRQEMAGAILAHPTVRHVAPILSDLTDDFELLRYTNAKSSANTVLVNVLRGCSISLPMKVAARNLPVGMMLSLPFGLDEELTKQALTIEHLLS